MKSTFIVATVYAVVGVVTADLAGAAPSTQLRTTWRLAAWLLSLAVFIGHIVYEHVRMRAPIRTAATRVAAAVAMSVFVLAVVGPVRSHWGMTDFWRSAALSVVLWPVLTGIPAFLFALAGGAMLKEVIAKRVR